MSDGETQSDELLKARAEIARASEERDRVLDMWQRQQEEKAKRGFEVSPFSEQLSQAVALHTEAVKLREQVATLTKERDLAREQVTAAEAKHTEAIARVGAMRKDSLLCHDYTAAMTLNRVLLAVGLKEE